VAADDPSTFRLRKVLLFEFFIVPAIISPLKVRVGTPSISVIKNTCLLPLPSGRLTLNLSARTSKEDDSVSDSNLIPATFLTPLASVTIDTAYCALMPFTDCCKTEIVAELLSTSVFNNALCSTSALKSVTTWLIL